MSAYFNIVDSIDVYLDIDLEYHSKLYLLIYFSIIFIYYIFMYEVISIFRTLLIISSIFKIEMYLPILVINEIFELINFSTDLYWIKLAISIGFIAFLLTFETRNFLEIKYSIW